MKIQTANGTLWPNVTREEFFKRESAILPGVVFLHDQDVGGDVEISTAPEAVGGPGTFTVRSTVTLAAKALKMVTLPTNDVYVKIQPLSSSVTYSIHSSTPFHYSRHQA